MQQALQQSQFEIEAKVALSDFELMLLKQKLPKDFNFSNVHEEKNFVYKAPWMTNGEFLRVRHEKLLVDRGGRLSFGGSWTFLTYKGKNIGQKINERKEVELDIRIGQHSNATLEEMLTALGFTIYSQYAKERKSYYFGDRECTIFLDAVWPLSKGSARQHYVEVEGKSEQNIFELLEKLGLAGKPIIRESYADIFTEEKNE